MDNTSYSQQPQGPMQPPPPENPQGQFQPPAPSNRQPSQNPDAGRGLAIAGLVVGAISVLLCWVPFVNNLVFFLALVGLGLAIPALVISSKNKSRARGLSIAGLILSALSIIGVFGTQALYSSMLDDVVESIEDSSDGVVESSESEEKEAATSEALGLGTTAEIGEYSVTVSAVNTNATDAILAVNPFNEAPVGQYVLVDVGVTYNGTEEGDPWLDLGTKFIGADARQYDTSTCSVVLEKEVHNVPTLEAGGVGEFQVCMDVPVEALANAKVFVEERMSFDNNRVYWSVP